MMQLLVATERTQGERPGDYAHCVPGELVWIQEPCDCPDCGCVRGFAGMSSHRPTTTVEVRDLPDFTERDLMMAVRATLVEGGWPASWTREVAIDCMEIGGHWSVGTVIERDGSMFSPRVETGVR